MMRKIVEIDETKCNGCGLCINACHEGALKLVNGKAKLLADVYCDGLGACLPECPTGAITIVEREAADFDEAAVRQHLASRRNAAGHSCPGQKPQIIREAAAAAAPASQLRQWPCQLKLVPVLAPYYEDASLVIAADCTAYAYAGIHNDFMRDAVTLIGCPKLDAADYTAKLTEILRHNNIKSITVLRMEVPCCGGIANAVQTALKNSGKQLPLRIVIIGIDGTIRKTD